MVKVLLADDNRMALDYFSHLIDWEAHGFQLTATAIDGESALIEFENTHPDIVITDIQMPNMTGIQLAEKINVIAPETIIIFLSSYEEFDYVRSALDLGVFDYILKHETKEKELLEKLTKAEIALEKKKKERYYIAEGNLSFFLNNIKNKKDIKDNNSILKAFPSEYHMFVICQDHIFIPLGQIVNQITVPFEENSFKNVIYKFNSIVAAVRLDNYFHIVLAHAVADPIDVYYEIKKEFENKFNQTVSVISIAENSNIMLCMEQFKTYSGSLKQKVFYPASIVLYRGALKETNEKKIPVLSTEEIMTMVEKNMFNKLCKELDSCFFQILRDRSYDGLKDIIKSCVTVLISFHHKLIDPRTNKLFSAYELHSLNCWYDAETIFEWLKKKFSQLESIFLETNVNLYSPNVKQVFLYVYSNYANSELSAEQVADNFCMNINKLNAQLKREAGETIWKLIIKVRMEKAAELLDSKEYKISEVSELVGYRTVSHFSNVFKKFFGISPQDYRRNHEK